MSPLSKVHFISPAVNHRSGLVLELIIYHLFYLIALLVGERFAMFLFAVGSFRDERWLSRSTLLCFVFVFRSSDLIIDINNTLVREIEFIYVTVH